MLEVEISKNIMTRVGAGFAGLLFALPLVAKTFTVNTVADTVDINPDDNVCADVNGQCSLRAAVQSANFDTDKDTIKLEAKTYRRSIAEQGGNDAVTGDLDITNDLELRGVNASSSIIDANNLHRVLHIQAGAKVTISNVTLTKGSTQNNDGLYTNTGGAVFVQQGASLSISDCIIKNNQSGNYGGGIGLHGKKSNLVINDCIIQNNTSNNGGGIFSMAWASIKVDRCTIENNIARNSGGGINNFTFSTATVTNTRLIGNRADQDGGGFYNGYQANATLESTAVYDNSAKIGGGIATGFGEGVIQLLNSTLSNNSAENEGGGIYTSNQFDTITIANSTISNNQAGTARGGGIFNSHGSVTLRNSILADNVDGSGRLQDCSGGINSQGYNILGNNSNCNFIINIKDQVGTPANPVNPLLAPLGDNGGPTFTHALLPNSPAIDAGNPLTPGSGGSTCERLDQRGAVRTGRGTCDSGAFEATGGGDAWLSVVNDIEVKPGYDLIQQVITVGNKGPNKVSSLKLVINVPVGSQNVSITGESWSCAQNANIINCTRDALNTRTESLLMMRFAPPIYNKEIITQARISTASDDPIAANNQVEVITIINKPPTVITQGSIKYKVNGGSLLIVPKAKIVDEDDTLLTAASIQIAQGYKPDEDELYWNGSGSIAVQWQAEIATLILTGEDTIIAYEQALAGVSYENKASNSNLSQRGISIKVRDAYDESVPASVALSFVEVDGSEDESAEDKDGVDASDNPASGGTGSQTTTQTSNKKNKAGVDPSLQSKTDWYLLIKSNSGQGEAGEENGSDSEETSTTDSYLLNKVALENEWLKVKDSGIDQSSVESKFTMVSVGSVVTAGMVNLFARSFGFLGVFFSFPLWSSVDPVQVMLLADKEFKRRRKEAEKAEKDESKGGHVGHVLDD